MASFLALLKGAWQILAMLPTLIGFYDRLKKEMDEAASRARQKADEERRKKLNAELDKLRLAREATDDQAAKDALSAIIDDYRKRLR